MVHAPARRSVVITGIGVICSLGRGHGEVWRRLLAGETGTSVISLFDPLPFGLEDCTVAEVSADNLTIPLQDLLPPAEIRRLGRFRQFTLIAAREALLDSQLDLENESIRTTGGCLLGTMSAGAAETERMVTAAHQGRKLRVSDYLGKRPSVALQDIARLFQIGGPMFGLDAACASGAYALTQSCNLISAGRVSWCLAGGAEASLVASNLKAVKALGAICTSRSDQPSQASRPFDKLRDGYVPAEGACFLVVENEEFARARGARCYARIGGFAEDTLADHPTRMSHQFAEAVMRRALDDAQVAVEKLGWIKAHATSTQRGDEAEAIAIRNLTNPYDIVCSAPKASVGHLLGASGSVELAFSAISLHEQVIPPTANLDELDSACPVNCVRTATPATFEFVLANSWGFGGSSCCVVLGRA